MTSQLDREAAESLANYRERERQRALKDGGSSRDPLMWSGMYSPSGMDVLAILFEVQNRPNPQIDIGKVDTNIALVICDCETADVPIVYASDSFATLTGYPQTEIRGQNCRFLQHPPANSRVAIPPEVIKYNERAIPDLRKALEDQREAQTSIWNFKKNGEPFVNILTMIPITYKENGAPGPGKRLVVGFQVDQRNTFISR
ncbi:putative vivid protein [Amylocarpus encephaloides]|uniref:Vivid protein n=1 Tax=Amylocarpus encephaloides TaxID=45428 RepID=A0A9P7YDQ6_9HELO|nr:putative vivid protein [Amylocarpus encephaloides]